MYQEQMKTKEQGMILLLKASTVEVSIFDILHHCHHQLQTLILLRHIKTNKNAYVPTHISYLKV
jgi:hypothetical protein